MLAFYKIFLFAFIAFGSFPQPGLSEVCHYNSCEVNSPQASANFSFNIFSHTELIREILFNEESIDIDESKTISNNNLSSLPNLNFFPGSYLREGNSNHFNFSHVSFLELDLPPPNFF